MYVKILGTMSLWWLSMILAWAPYSGLCYLYIFLSALQSLSLFYICVLGCKRVRYLIRTSCLFSWCQRGIEPGPSEWGEELSSINVNYY